MKTYFTGTYLHTIDERGRVALPAKLRDKLGEQVAITNGRHQKCLAVYPHETWQALADRILESPSTNPSQNDMRLYTFGDAWEDTVDKQGRVPIPDYLREAAGLKADVAVVGAGDHLQIWDREAWVAKRAELRKNPPELPG